MSIYMQIPNTQGNVTAKGFEGWVELSHLDFSAKRNVLMKVGQQTDRDFNAPHINEMTIIKNVDKSSPFFFESLLNGRTMDTITMAICKNGSDAKVLSQYILHDVMVSYYEEQVDGMSEKGGQECLSLNFTKIEKRYTPYDTQGKAEAPISAGYDLSTAQAA